MYVKITNGDVETYPYNVGQLRRDNPNTSFPKQIPDEMLESYGVMPVTVASMPTINDRTQKVEQANAPSLTSGDWTIWWSISSKTADEISDYDNNAEASNRSKRNSLLSATDFYALSDVTMSTEMAAYRQAMRDITSHANFPNLDDADWPTKP